MDYLYDKTAGVVKFVSKGHDDKEHINARLRVILAEIQNEITNGTTNRSADAYYALKDQARRISAKISSKTESQHDPMGFWFGGMSN